MSHRIRQKTVVSINGKSYGDCPMCGPHVPVVKSLNSWVCKARISEMAKAARQKAQARIRKPKKAVSAIRAVETKRALNATELKKLLRSELSRIVRQRDGFCCFLCGERVEPGIRAWQGQAAHLRPIGKLPPEYRYDPDFCVWLCGTHHAEYDGNAYRGKVAAHQLPVLEKLRREKPGIYERLAALPISRGDDKSRPHELRERLEALRAIRFDNDIAA